MVLNHEQLQLQHHHASQQKGEVWYEEVARPVVSLPCTILPPTGQSMTQDPRTQKQTQFPSVPKTAKRGVLKGVEDDVNSCSSEGGQPQGDEGNSVLVQALAGSIWSNLMENDSRPRYNFKTPSWGSVMTLSNFR